MTSYEFILNLTDLYLSLLKILQRRGEGGSGREVSTKWIFARFEHKIHTQKKINVLPLSQSIFKDTSSIGRKKNRMYLSLLKILLRRGGQRT